MNTHEGDETRIQQRALDPVAVDGIGAIQDDQGNPFARSRLHALVQSGDVGIEANSHVLDVVDQ